FLGRFLSFCWHRLFPHFNPQSRWVCEGFEKLHLRFIHPQNFFVKTFFAFAQIFFTSVRAIIFLEAREIFSLSPSREKIVTAFSSLSMPMFGSLKSFATIISQFFVAILPHTCTSTFF